MAVAASSNQNAAPQNGFYEHNGHTYYYENNRMYQNREYDNWGHVYYFGSDGARVDNQDATIVNGKHAGATYYFGNDGAALTDHFQNKNGKTYYYGDNGQQYRNRFYTNWGHTYYFGNDGARYTNQWYSNWGHKYYFGSDGARLTNQFLTQNGKVYYFDNNGVMYQNQFYTNWGHTYYFGSDGARYTNQFMWNNGKLYYFGSDGAMYQDQFYTNWGHTYYFGSDGARYTNQSYTNWGHSYYFDGLGALATNQYITQDGIRYWADGQGILTISTPVVNSAENYIDGHDYYVDANGTRHAQTQYDGWQWPFPQRSGDYFLSGQLFGQSAASSFRKNSFHDGLDFGVTTYPGTYVQAVHGGKVIAVSYTPGCEYYVLVDDGRYLYMYQEAFTGYDQIYVHQGQVIHPGTIIGRRNTSHLHLGITANHDFENDLYNSFNANGPWLNPATVIRDGIAGRLK